MHPRSLVLALIIGFGTVADAPAADVPAGEQPAPPVRTVEIVVRGGYHPDRVVAKADEPLSLRFVRKEYTGCTLEVVFPTLGIRRTLPPDEPVLIDLGKLPAGEVPFHCGMNMVHGVVVVGP